MISRGYLAKRMMPVSGRKTVDRWWKSEVGTHGTAVAKAVKRKSQQKAPHQLLTIGSGDFDQEYTVQLGH